VFSPTEVATLGYDYLKYKNEHKELAVAFPVTKMSNRVYPLSAGEVMTIIARPGHSKTGLMMAWARKRASIIKPHPKRVVVYATWEQSVEELNSFYIAAEQKVSITAMAKGDLSPHDFERVMQATSDRISEPMFFIGHSTMRKSGRTPITVSSLGNAIEEIQGQGFDIDCLYADYLQRIAMEGNSDNPFFGYSKIMDDLKNLALWLGIPMVVGVQASREVESLKLPIPEMHHAQMTSNIEQSSDRVLSLVRPRRYRKEGEQFGNVIVSGHNQLLITVLKQKLGEGNFSEWTTFNPIYNKLDAAELLNPVPDEIVEAV
jgi:Replicative DNA helicase